jgi:hypothetical protein
VRHFGLVEDAGHVVAVSLRVGGVLFFCSDAFHAGIENWIVMAPSKKTKRVPEVDTIVDFVSRDNIVELVGNSSDKCRPNLLM